MDAITEFIKNFHPSHWGLGLWEFLAIIGLAFVGLILITWLVSFLPTRTAELIRAIVRWTLAVVSFALTLLVVLNAILTREYSGLFIIILLMVSSRIDHWYKLYDNFVDRQVNKER